MELGACVSLKNVIRFVYSHFKRVVNKNRRISKAVTDLYNRRSNQLNFTFFLFKSFLK